LASHEAPSARYSAWRLCGLEPVDPRRSRHVRRAGSGRSRADVFTLSPSTATRANVTRTARATASTGPPEDRKVVLVGPRDLKALRLEPLDEPRGRRPAENTAPPLRIRNQFTRAIRACISSETGACAGPPRTSCSRRARRRSTPSAKRPLRAVRRWRRRDRLDAARELGPVRTDGRRVHAQAAQCGGNRRSSRGWFPLTRDIKGIDRV